MQGVRMDRELCGLGFPFTAWMPETELGLQVLPNQLASIFFGFVCVHVLLAC